MDVEGHELNALKGAISTIQTFKPDLIIEFNPTALNSQSFFGADKLLEYLFSSFPSVWVIAEHGRLVKVKNLDNIYKVMSKGRGIEDLFCSFSHRPPKTGISLVEKAYLYLRKLKRDFVDQERTVLKPDYVILIPEEVKAKVGTTVEIEVTLANKSLIAFSSSFKQPINLSYHLLKNEEKILHDGLRTPLPMKILQNSSATFNMQVEIPKEAGEYTLQPSLVQEGYCWFYQQNPKLTFHLRLIALEKTSHP